MAAFEYVSLDAAGKEHKGVLEGDTPRQIRQQLRDKNWIPVSITPVSQKEEKQAQSRSPFSRGLSSADLALVTRQFATLIQAGLTVEETLQAVSQQNDKPRIKSMLLAVRSKVTEGHSFARALSDFPHIFDELYLATVDAGEQSGFLPTVFDRLADYTESRQILKQKIMLALIYPVMVVVISLLVVFGLLTYVVPQVVSVFADMGQELPALTTGLITLSELAREYGLVLFLLTIATIIGTRMALKKPSIKMAWHRLLLKLPLFSTLVRGINTARFARTLSILSASGVPVLDALRISAQVVTNLPMFAAIEAAAKRVSEGSNLHSALKKSGYFPPMTLHLIASGESSGKLEQMLERAAENQERSLDTTIETLLGFLGPLIMLVLGGLVLLIVLAMLLPIFELNTLIS